jgi:amino acid transporter
MATREQAETRRSLTRSVGLVGAIGVAIAGMAPTLAMNLNPQEPAEHVGAAVPLVFALATVAVLLVAWCFARLARLHPHAGSVYSFVGATLGPRTGFVAGWSLLGAYLSFQVVTISGVAVFGRSFLSSTGIWPGANADLIALAGGVVLLVVALSSTNSVTTLLLALEGLAILAMLTLAGIVLAHVARGDGPEGGSDPAALFTLPEGAGLAALALGLSFGFLSFAGFEQVATLGEDARNPQRSIPFALLATALLGGVVYIVITSAQVLGIGTSADALRRFENSPGLLQDLGDLYVGAWAGDAMEALATFSALGGALALVVATSRLLFAFSRDLAPRLPTARVAGGNGTPRVAALTAIGFGLAGYFGVRLLAGASPKDAFFWWSTAGAIAILVPYLILTVGAVLVFVRFRGLHRLETLIPIVALAVIAYTITVTLYPPGQGAYLVIPFVVLAWIVASTLLVVTRPGIGDRVRAGLLGTPADD